MADPLSELVLIYFVLKLSICEVLRFSLWMILQILCCLLPCRNKKGKFYTCAIRPAAIYGPGEERHFPRIMALAKLGLLPFKIGMTNVKTDWVYVDNLVLALILASMGLLDDIPGREGRPIAAGQPYFISDGKMMVYSVKKNPLQFNCTIFLATSRCAGKCNPTWNSLNLGLIDVHISPCFIAFKSFQKIMGSLHSLFISLFFFHIS